MAYLDQIGKSMEAKPRTPEETYGPALQKAREDLTHTTPQQLAANAAVAFKPLETGKGQFQIPFFGKVYQVYWPSGTVVRAEDEEPADIATTILLLHYLLTADGMPMASRWIAFRGLPGGLGYDAAFQRRANLRLARAFGTDAEAFETAAGRMGGERLTFGDASFVFRALPRVWLAVVLHLADDEFPADANVLFDATASHYLPTEDLAVLGGMTAGWLIKAARAQ